MNKTGGGSALQRPEIKSVAADASAASGQFSETASKTAKPANQIGKQLIGLVLAGVLLWLSFRGVDLGQLWHRTQSLNPAWLVGLCVCSVASHWLRAMRWVFMLQPLADTNGVGDARPHKVSVWNAFCAVMIGYAVNIPIPRGGEVARVLSICKSEKLPWPGVVPTMLIDRLLDIAMLVLLIGLTLVMLPVDVKNSMPWLVPTGGALCLATFIGLLLLPKLGVILKFVLEQPLVKTKLPQGLQQSLAALTEQFDQGTQCLNNATAFPAIGGLSLAIWFCYWLNFYLVIWAFGLEKTVDLSRSLMVFAISSVSVLAPTPGSVGSYHYCASKALNMVAGVDEGQALALVTVLHAVSFVFIVCLTAAVCFLIQSSVAKRQPAEQ